MMLSTEFSTIYNKHNCAFTHLTESCSKTTLKLIQDTHNIFNADFEQVFSYWEV